MHNQSQPGTRCEKQRLLELPGGGDDGSPEALSRPCCWPGASPEPLRAQSSAQGRAEGKPQDGRRLGCG